MSLNLCIRIVKRSEGGRKGRPNEAINFVCVYRLLSGTIPDWYRPIDADPIDADPIDADPIDADPIEARPDWCPKGPKRTWHQKVGINEAGINWTGINRVIPTFQWWGIGGQHEKKNFTLRSVDPFGPPSLRFAIRIHSFTDILFRKEGVMISNHAFELVEEMLKMTLRSVGPTGLPCSALAKFFNQVYWIVCKILSVLP